MEPSTGSSLRLNAARSHKGRIEEGSLTSEQTGTVYPILRGIRRFVPESVYADSFGLQLDSPMSWQEVERVLGAVGAKEGSFRTKVPVNVIGTR